MVSPGDMLSLINKGGIIAVLLIAITALMWLVRWLFKLLLERQDLAISYREALVEKRDQQLAELRGLLANQQSLFDRSLDMQQTLLDRLSGEFGRRAAP